MSVLVVTFAPSKNLAGYLMDFTKSTPRTIDQANEIGARVRIMASRESDRKGCRDGKHRID